MARGRLRGGLGAFHLCRPGDGPHLRGPEERGDLRGLSLDQFAARAASYYGEIDGTHPFREGNSRTIRQFFVDLAHGAGFDPDWSACGVDEAAGRALYHARDAAWMQAKPDALCAIIRAGLKPL